MKCTTNLNRAQNVKPRLRPAIRWTLDRPLEKEIHHEPVRRATYGERRFDRTQRERSPPRPAIISAVHRTFYLEWVGLVTGQILPPTVAGLPDTEIPASHRRRGHVRGGHPNAF